MAETATAAPKAATNNKKPRAKRGEGVYKTSLYHVYKRDEKKALVPVKDVTARNANLAGAQVVEQNPKLAGVELTGLAQPVGEVPRRGEPVPELAAPERAFAEKYLGGTPFRYDARHAWLRVTPDKFVSWDFAKLPRPG